MKRVILPFIAVSFFVIVKALVYLETFLLGTLSNKIMQIILPHLIYSLLGFIFGVLLYVMVCLLDKQDIRIIFRENKFYKSSLFLVGFGLLICSLIPNLTWSYWLGTQEVGIFGWFLNPLKNVTTHLLMSILAGCLIIKSLVQQET